LILSVSMGWMIFDRPADDEESGVADREDEAVQNSRTGPPPAEKAIPVKKTARRIAIIVDDIGYDLAPVRALMKIDAPLTFSVLPHCIHTGEAVQMLHKARKEILLHLPMEPRQFPEKNPGAGVLLVGMKDEELLQSLEEALSSVPHAVGVNNHMGSRFMEDRKRLSVIFRSLKEKNLFFVDSLTTSRSRGRSLAKEMGLPLLSRDIFIDNSRDTSMTQQEIRKVIKARDRGQRLIVIGHPYPETVSALRASVRAFQSEGIEIVPVSKLMER